MQRTTKTVLATIASLAIASAALASMDNLKALKAAYPNSNAKCTTCHVKPMPKKGDSEFNVFGKDVSTKAVVDAKAAKKTYDFKKVEALDSDGDGKTNAAELAAGTNPGDPKSK